MDEIKFGEIKAKYGLYASWAIWEPDPEIAGYHFPLSKYSYQEIKDKIKPNIVMVGLNTSDSNKRMDFSNFHIDRPLKDGTKKNIKRLICAIKGSIFEGAYMTDIVKRNDLGGDSKEVIEKVRACEELQKECIERLNDELEILGSKSLIIALGDVVEEVLLKILNMQHFESYVKVPHYSKRKYYDMSENEAQKEYNDEFWADILRNIPDNFKTLELYIDAVKKSSNAIKYVPENLKEQVKKECEAAKS
jgi:hypothetical protein